MYTTFCVCVRVRAVTQLCPTLGGFSAYWIFPTRIQEWLAISYSRGSSRSRIEPVSLASPALAGRFFTTVPPGKPHSTLDNVPKLQCRYPWIGKHINTGIVIQYMTGVHIQFMYMYGIRIQYMTYNFRSFLKFMSFESVMLSSHLILWHRLFLLSSVFPSIRIFFTMTLFWVISKIHKINLWWK